MNQKTNLLCFVFLLLSFLIQVQPREIAFNFFYIVRLTPSLAELGISPLSRERGRVPKVRRGELREKTDHIAK